MRDLVRGSSRNLLKLYEDPGDLLARPAGKNSTVTETMLQKKETEEKTERTETETKGRGAADGGRHRQMDAQTDSQTESRSVLSQVQTSAH